MMTRSDLKDVVPDKNYFIRYASSFDYHYDANLDQTELLWKCLRCGELIPRSFKLPDFCPSCGARKTEFVLNDED